MEVWRQPKSLDVIYFLHFRSEWESAEERFQAMLIIGNLMDRFCHLYVPFIQSKCLSSVLAGSPTLSNDSA